MSIKETIANRLKKLRKEKGLNQGQLAKKLGVSRASVSLYEKGKRIPETEILKAMTDALSVSADYLIGNHDTESADLDMISICKKLSLDEITVEHLMKTDYVRTFVKMLVHDDCSWIEDGQSSTIKCLLEYLQYKKSDVAEARYTVSKLKKTKAIEDFGDNIKIQHVIPEVRTFTDEDILATYLLKSQQRLAKLKENIEKHMPEYLEEED